MNKMKKDLFLAALTLLSLSSAEALGGIVELKNQDYLDVIVGHPHSIPIVEEDGDDVTIKCDSTLYNVDIVIRDQYRNVIHHSTQTIGPNETTIYVPSTDGESEKTSIDLYYDRKHLSGYFE
ncbi:MAG TPA: hypothetical protein DEQ27_04395 [Prevotella sp.]|nr:hypothetical protein [Prevotella sp.]